MVTGETYADRGTKSHTVIFLIFHEDFNPYTLQADLALISVFEEFEYRLIFYSFDIDIKRYSRIYDVRNLL